MSSSNMPACRKKACVYLRQSRSIPEALRWGQAVRPSRTDERSEYGVHAVWGNLPDWAYLYDKNIDVE
jgi:hypothetical protein